MRRKPRRARAGHRQRAQQRVLAAADFDHLHPAQSISGRAGDRCRISRTTRPISTHIYVAGANGTQVPLSAVVHYTRGLSPLAVYHSGSFPIDDGFVRPAARRAAGDRDRQYPARRRRTAYAGRHSRQLRRQCRAISSKTTGRQPLLILGALIAIYIVLGVLYESLIHPLTIISTLPSAGLGALLALQITNTPLTDHRLYRHHSADRHRQEERHHDRGLRAGGRAAPRPDPRADAIFEACIARFRPILMTTMAALFAGIAADPRDRPRHRIAAAAGHHHHRRLVRVADPDALHDAGDLSADRPAAPAPRAGASGGARGIAVRPLRARLLVPARSV